MKHSIQVRLMHKCRIVSAGLRAILSTQPDFVVSGEPPAGACVIIADFETAIALARDCWHPVLALTYQAKGRAIMHALESGVRGYVIQDCDASEVIEGVRRLSCGEYYLSPSASRQEAEWRQRTPLTQREAEVLQVLVRGNSDKMIARGLGIGVGTVKTHMRQLFLKLDASTRTQVVIRAMDLGLHEVLQQ